MVTNRIDPTRIIPLAREARTAIDPDGRLFVYPWEFNRLPLTPIARSVYPYLWSCAKRVFGPSGQVCWGAHPSLSVIAKVCILQGQPSATVAALRRSAGAAIDELILFGMIRKGKISSEFGFDRNIYYFNPLDSWVKPAEPVKSRNVRKGRGHRSPVDLGMSDLDAPRSPLDLGMSDLDAPRSPLDLGIDDSDAPRSPLDLGIDDSDAPRSPLDLGDPRSPLDLARSPLDHYLYKEVEIPLDPQGLNDLKDLDLELDLGVREEKNEEPESDRTVCTTDTSIGTNEPIDVICVEIQPEESLLDGSRTFRKKRSPRNSSAGGKNR